MMSTGGNSFLAQMRTGRLLLLYVGDMAFICTKCIELII